MKLNALEFVVLLAIIICSALLVAGCSHVATSPKDCCQRLDVRTNEMQEFNRFCKVLVFAAQRTDKNTKTYESIENRLGVCRFVFGVDNDSDLLSAGPDETYYKVRQYIIPAPSEGGWQMPLDCDPMQPSCEEF
jgi:hypothetical protein